MNHRFLAGAAALAVSSSTLLGAGSLPALRSTGTLVVQANVQGNPVNIGGNVALYHNGARYRLDVLTLGFPGTDQNLSALASTLIGPGGVSVVYDGATGAMTAWSNANRTYYVMSPPRTPGSPSAPAAAATVASGSGDPLSALTTLAAALKNVQSASVQMTGHSTVNGHPATNLDLQLKRTLPGKPAEDYHAQLALADDLGDFPVQIALASTPSSRDAFGGTMRLDLTNVQTVAPDDSVFAIPAGYTPTTSLSGVLGHGLSF